MPEPTKADLKAAVTALTEENAALYDLFAAIRDGASGHEVLPWIIGYAGNIGDNEFERGNVRLLRAHARNLRRGPGCHAEHEGYYCDLRGGHDPARHEVHGDDGELITAWDPEPEPVTDSGRTCPCCTDDPLHSGDCNCREDCGVTRCQAADPGPGCLCDQTDASLCPVHGAREDTDGETWRTDGGEDRCECSHQEPEHGYYASGTAPAAARECRHPGCGCGRYRLAAPRPQDGPPAVVSGDVVLEVRALLS